MNQYYIYRLEHGLSPAERRGREQRAADQCIGELVVALAEVRSAVAITLCHRLGGLKALGRANRTSKKAGVVAAAPARH